MAKYVCSICGFVYDEAIGIPQAGIAPGTKWEDLPEDWVCPICGATKPEFGKQGDVAAVGFNERSRTPESSSDMLELSALQISALCTNLARGCEKQYKANEAARFRELSEYFKGIAEPTDSPNLGQLMDLIEGDLSVGFVNANAEAANAKDRGALRALVWSEKVTRILKSLLTRYQKEGDAILANTGVYVCTICGFVYIGDTPPDVCPVCKVPNWKFEKVEGRQ